MKYTSCFIGIPLPTEFEEDFKELGLKIEGILPGIALSYAKTPHITLYYLDMKSQNNLDEIANMIKHSKKIIANVCLSIGGFGLFSPNNSKVLFIGVDSEPRLTTFNELISKDLNDYSAIDNTLGFKPHITLGR